MPSSQVAEKAKRDIDRQVAKLLRDLGDPKPPLSLDLVRELLLLDRAYYSSTVEGGLTGFVHRLKVGAKQVLMRPRLLLEAIRSANLKALWLPDQRRILIDQELHPLRQRWGEAHEIGHAITPWHKCFAYGDDESTLRLDFQAQIEAEANFAAGRLLFLLDRFAEEVRSGDITLKRIRERAKSYGNSATSALWRIVEAGEGPVVGLIGAHPFDFRINESEAVRHLIRSQRFAAEFAAVTGLELFSKMRSYCRGKRGPVGEGELLLEDGRGDPHAFHFESFHNGYDVLTLGIWRRKSGLSIAVPGNRSGIRRISG